MILRVALILALSIPTAAWGKPDYTLPNRCIFIKSYYSMLVVTGPPPEMRRFVGVYCSVKHHPIHHPLVNHWQVQNEYDTLVEESADGKLTFYFSNPIEHHFMSRVIEIYEWDLARRTRGIYEKPQWRSQDVLDTDLR